MRFAVGSYVMILLVYLVWSHVWGESPERPLKPLRLSAARIVEKQEPSLPLLALRSPQSLDTGLADEKLLHRIHLLDGDSNPSEAHYINFDRHGLIVQSNGDGGDTGQRTGMFYYVHHDPEGFSRALDVLEVEPGLYVRHPFQDDFRDKIPRFSRDQQRPIVIALGKYRMYDRLWRITKNHMLRLGKYQNKDIAGPSHMGEYIRAFRFKPLYPVLLATDAMLIVGSLEAAVVSRWDPGFTDDNNHLMALLQAQDVMPTPLSWVARKLYRNFRAPSVGSSHFGESCPVQGALLWYHRTESGGNPLIAEAYRPLVRDL
jgi:hypothetical protein